LYIDLQPAAEATATASSLATLKSRMFFFTLRELAYLGCLGKHTVQRMLLLFWVNVVILGRLMLSQF